MAEHLCVKQAVLGSIPGDDQLFLILYCLKKACERERMSKKTAEKEIISRNFGIMYYKNLKMSGGLK